MQHFLLCILQQLSSSLFEERRRRCGSRNRLRELLSCRRRFLSKQYCFSCSGRWSKQDCNSCENGNEDQIESFYVHKESQVAGWRYKSLLRNIITGRRISFAPAQPGSGFNCCKYRAYLLDLHCFTRELQNSSAVTGAAFESPLAGRAIVVGAG